MQMIAYRLQPWSRIQPVRRVGAAEAWHMACFLLMVTCPKSAGLVGHIPMEISLAT